MCSAQLFTHHNSVEIPATTNNEKEKMSVKRKSNKNQIGLFYLTERQN